MRAALTIALLLAAPAAAHTIEVGPNAPVHSLHDAAEQAQDGDTIHLAAGQYYECAFLHAKSLTLQGDGDATVLTDATCGEKAILVAQGDGLTIRDLVLTRARVPDMNGAGIRLEAQGLLAERVRFVNDQVGILAGASGAGEIRIVACRFEGGGVAGDRPSSALLVGAVARLVVERSTFTGVKGAQVSTDAARTELTGNRIETGAEPGAGAAVTASGGFLLMQGNTIAVGPNPPPRAAVVLATGSGAELGGNTLLNSTGRPMTLLLDWMHATPTMQSNTIGAGDSETSSDGVWRHRAGTAARNWAAKARGVAGRAKRALAVLLGR